MAPRLALLAAALTLAPLAAEAQNTYRCVGTDGRKYYGATVPPQCQGVPVELMSPQGVVLRRSDPEGEQKDREAKAAEAAKRKEQDVIAKDQARRNQALLATYTSEKDIEEARLRALVENEKAIKEVEQRINEIRKRQAAYNKEMEFFQEGRPDADKDKKGKSAVPAKSAAKPPPKLLEDIKNTETDIKAQEAVLVAKKKEVDSINAKYADDKKRFVELVAPPRK